MTEAPEREAQPCPMEPERPGAEHLWLDRLLGEWECEGQATMRPGEEPERFSTTESVRSLGGLWVVAEGRGEMPGGGTMVSITTLGYDPRKGRFVGTFVASMMTHMWVYDGTLDPSGTTLTLDTNGPDFAADGKKDARFQDVVEILGPDRRTLTSRMLGADGTWTQVMRAEYRRRG